MTASFAIPSSYWLWSTKLHPTEGVIPDRPLHPTTHERIDGAYHGIVEADLPEGTVLMTVTAGILSTSGTHYVVLGDVLQHVWEREAADLHDPAGATARLRERLRREAELSSVSRRFRMRPDHGLTAGQFLPWGGWHAVVTAVTARQVWARAATEDEILAAGVVLPVAPVSAELLAAIRAEAAEDAAAHEAA